MTRQNLLSIFFVALLLVVLYGIILILSPFLRPMFWAATIAFGFYPLYLKFLKTTGDNRNLASFLTTLLVFLIVVPIVLFAAFSIVHEAIVLYGWLTREIANGGTEAFIERLRQLPIVQKIDQSDLLQWDFLRDNIKKCLLSSISFLGNLTVSQALPIVRNLFFAVINFFLMLFLVFFFLKDGIKIYGFIYEITPLEEHVKKNVFTQLSDTFSAVLRGQIVTAFAQSILGGLSYWLLGLPLPLFFAGATFLAAMVPVFGAAMIWVPFVVYLLIIHSYTKAVILLLLGTFVISLVDNLLKPMLIGEKTKLPYLLLFLGILGGVQVFGIIGIFLAPTVLSLFFVLIKIYQERFFSHEAE